MMTSLIASVLSKTSGLTIVWVASMICSSRLHIKGLMTQMRCLNLRYQLYDEIASHLYCNTKMHIHDTEIVEVIIENPLYDCLVNNLNVSIDDLLQNNVINEDENV